MLRPSPVSYLDRPLRTEAQAKADLEAARFAKITRHLRVNGQPIEDVARIIELERSARQ